MYQLTHPPFRHRLGRKCECAKQLCHDLPEQLRQFIGEGDPSVNVQPLEEDMNTLKNAQDRVVACRDIPHSLTVR